MNRWCYLDLRYYKYKLSADVVTDLTQYGIPVNAIDKCRQFQPPLSTAHFELAANGTLTIRKDYAWDGPSGPTIDTDTFMRGSLVHDCLYQMMRTGQFKLEFRSFADLALRKICEQDGMMKLRAWWVHKGVSWFGEKNARPSSTGDRPDETCLKIPLA